MMYRNLACRLAAVPAALALVGLAQAQDPEALPVCVNNGPYTAECTGQVTCVPVTSAGSFDPDGTPITIFWFEECAPGFFDDPTSPTPNYCIDLLGGCTKTCVFELRVFSGGQVSKCVSSVTVVDTTGPVITCPPDFTAIWAGGIPAGQTDPVNTGFATAVDCDPAPVITYSDVAVPNTMAGQPEVVITRTWVATDYCGNPSSCVQIITLLSPSTGLGAVLDIQPGSCPNTLNASATEGVLQMTVYGTTSFNPANIDRSSLVLRRYDNHGSVITRVNAKLLDVGRPGPNGNLSCGSVLKDGRVDLQLSYSLAQVAQAFDALAELPGHSFDIALTGRLTDGRLFTLRDAVAVQ